ncbi:hypothetical protein KSF_101900 [Reticulibacter mediterranei]|uniref:Uncharacterized protein n=1 Tax=Reticulibacter mediterranei TaxID=2778369 RepID=A0A8J3NA93_9CHLR|nr:hypothetical protein [Reticulibacter mediterranei]GHP00143.1 hypothetical protein KSF_101900 [Reticulibacter mediterranei]
MAPQYIGNIGKLANGIVSVNAYGVLDQITFPLLFKVYKPHTRLLPEDTYKTKPELAVEILEELEQRDFQFDVVLADSRLWGKLHVHQRVGETAPQIRAGHPLQPWSLATCRQSHPPVVLAAL